MTPEHDPDFERYSLQKLVVIEPSIGAMTVTSITSITPYYLYYRYYQPKHTRAI